jgi:hypothetical protein
MTSWNDRLAALRIMEAGLIAAIKIAKKEALAESLELNAKHRVKQWETPFGDMVLVKGDPTAYVRDVEAYTKYVAAHLDGSVVTETVTRVAPWADKQIMDRLAVVGDVVVDSVSGEVVEWAGVKPPSPHMSLPASAKATRARGQAVDWVLAQLDALPKEIGT